MRYFRDVELLCERDTIANCTNVTVPGHYRIELDALQAKRPISTQSRASWEIDVAGFRPGFGERLPLVNLGYDVDLGGTNAVRAGSMHEMTVEAGDQPE